jgi:hypothetical protein
VNRRKYNFDDEYKEVRVEDISPLHEPKVHEKVEKPQVLTSDMLFASYISMPARVGLGDVEDKTIVIYDYTLNDLPGGRQVAAIDANIQEWNAKVSLVTHSKVVIDELTRLRSKKILPSKNGLIIKPRKRLSGNGREYWTITP